MILRITSVDQFGHQIRQFRCCHHISYENTFSFQDFEFKVADPGLEPALLVMEGTTHCARGRHIIFNHHSKPTREKALYAGKQG